jgi:CubicO group peptidase (beta-lactamase class C family)
MGPQVRGALLLAQSERTWTLRVGGFEVQATQVGDSVTLALPGGQGTLRVWTGASSRASASAGAPRAYWVQPSHSDPAYALPVPLTAAGAGQWRGAVVPVDAEFPLYLQISRATTASGATQLRAVFRNPAQNWPGRVPFYIVAREGNTLAFTNPRTGAVQYRQPYDSSQRTITFDFGAPIVLRPRTLNQAVGFVARSPGLPPYRYRLPAALNDSWPVQHAAQLQIDSAALTAIVQELAAVSPLSDSAPRVHALLVARHGQLVLDEYFRGYTVGSLHDLRSASKTITSIMAGAAMHRGAVLSSATTLTNSPITLGNLLSHSSGKACNDDDDASPGNEDTMQSQHAQPNWYAFFAALPTVTAPGSTYAYCSAGINMAGQLIGKATGVWLTRFFDDALARPMHFGSYGINLMPTGEAYSGGGMHLLPRDFLKFGPLMLSGGIWRGTRVVSAAWVRESMAHHINRPDGSADGLGWHRHVLSVNGRQYQTIEAGGNGGQFLVLVPELDLSIVVTAGNYRQFDVWWRIYTALIPRVIAAVR